MTDALRKVYRFEGMRCLYKVPSDIPLIGFEKRNLCFHNNVYGNLCMYVCVYVHVLVVLKLFTQYLKKGYSESFHIKYVSVSY